MRFIGKLVGPKQYRDILANDWRTCKARQEGVIGIMPLSSGYDAAVTVRWTGVVVRNGGVPNFLATMSVERSVPGRFP
jgi:hypothetical protein